MNLNILSTPQNNPITLYVKGLYVNNVQITGNGGNPDALTNAVITEDVIPNSLCVFTGMNKTDCVSDDTITIDRNTHITTINYDLVCEDNISIKNGNILGLYSDDNSNTCSIQCDNDGNLNLNSVQDKQVNINNNLECGGNVSCVGINSYTDIRIFNTPSNNKFSFLAMNEDDGLDIVNHNVGGEITFSTLEYTRTLKQLVEDIENIKTLLKNLTDITI